MRTRVVRSNETTYSDSYQRKNVERVNTQNFRPRTTTGLHYTSTPKTLYTTNFTNKNYTYVRPRSAKTELMQLPKEYNSTIKPNLAPPTPESDYQHYFGTPGQHSISKYNFAPTIRNLSKSTRADIEGTTKITHHPPGYCGYIPREWHGNKGKTPRQDPSFGDIYWQHHDGKEGYSGYTPSCATNANVSTLKRASTTYRDMCDEIGFKLD